LKSLNRCKSFYAVVHTVRVWAVKSRGIVCEHIYESYAEIDVRRRPDELDYFSKIISVCRG
jgi:hypothetical protein